MIKSLLEFNNANHDNKLIMTTHSPYLINYISIAIQANYLNDKIKSNDNSPILLKKINSIISEKSTISGENVMVYQLDETNGTIIKLANPEGIPSSRNYLNESLRYGNEMFDKLLEIEQEL